MVDGIFATDLRGSPHVSKLGFMMDMTPPKTTDYNTYGLDTVRHSDVFDDVSNFGKQISSATLGASELSKYETYIYQSRYLNTQQCKDLTAMHYQRMMMNYSEKIMLLTEGVSMSQLSETGVFSNEHMRSITILSICGRYHKLSDDIGDGWTVEGGSSFALYNYMLKLVKLIYSAVVDGGGVESSDPVGKSRFFYNFLMKGMVPPYSAYNGNYNDSYNINSIHSVQRITLLYCLSLNLLEALLSFDTNLILNKEDEAHNIISYIICCFVEDFLRNSREDLIFDDPITPIRFGPDVTNNMELFSKHWSVLNGFLCNGANINNRSLLIKCIKALSNMLESAQKGRSILVWCYIVYIRLSPSDVLYDNHKIPRSLFDELGRNKYVTQTKCVVDTLAVCLEDSKFSQYVQDHINSEKFLKIFIINVCSLIEHRKEDLAVPILNLLNTILDSFHKILQNLANTFSINSDENPSKKTQAISSAVVFIMKIIFYGKGNLQTVTCMIFYKLLTCADVTKCLNLKTRRVMFRLLLEAVGILESTRVIGVNATEVMGKLLVLDALMRRNSKEIMTELRGINIIELRNIVLRTSTGSMETLCNVLSSGDLPFRLLAYDTILKQNPTDTFICCTFATVINKCPSVSTLLSQYTGGNYLTPSGFLSALKFSSVISDKYGNSNSQINLKFGLLFVHLLVSSIHDKCNAAKQKLIQSMLSKDDGKVEIIMKYRKEIDKKQLQIDQLYKKEMEHNQNLQRLKTEHLEKTKNENIRLQNIISENKSTIHDLQAKLDTLKSKYSNLQNDITRLNLDKEQTHELNKQLKIKNQSLETELSELNNKVRDYDVKSQKLKKYQNDNDKLLAEVNELTNQLNNLYRMLIYLASKYKNDAILLEQQNETLNKLKMQLTQQKTKTDELESTLRNMEYSLNDLRNNKMAREQEVIRLKEEISKREISLNQATRSIQDAQDKISQLTHTIQKREDTCTQLKHQLNEKDRELADRRQQLATIASACNARPL